MALKSHWNKVDAWTAIKKLRRAVEANREKNDVKNWADIKRTKIFEGVKWNL